QAVPGPAAELALKRELLPSLTLAEVNAVSGLLARGRDVEITGPPSMMRPSEESIRATLRTVLSSQIAPYEDPGAPLPLVTQRPTAGSVVKATTIPEVGVTEWTLQNGVRVVVKPTDFSGDDIRMTAFSPGGTSLVSDADFDSARYAAGVVLAGGLG